MSQLKVLIVGAGGLGVPAALRLAHCGIAQLTLLDPERVELSNLARQVIYRIADIGQFKAEAAVRRLTAKFPQLHAEPIVAAMDAGNAAALVARHHFIIDGTDDPAAKFLINDTCIAAGRPFVYAGVLGFTGQAMTVLPGRTACLRCLFEAPPSQAEVASCRDAGILGPVAGVIGAIQAEQAIALARKGHPALAGKILTYDARNSRIRVTAAASRRGCGCGAYEYLTGAGAGRGGITEGKL